MHEFALAQEIVATVSSKVTEGLENIQSIDIDVGAFSGVVVDSLDFGLQALFEEESITGIQININTIPTIAACECGYGANTEKAEVKIDVAEATGDAPEMEKVATPEVRTIEEVCDFMKVSPEKVLFHREDIRKHFQMKPPPLILLP